MKEIKIKCRGVQTVIWGVQELKKDDWAKRERGGAAGPVERKTEPVWFK